jgi:hypothetical protein
MKKATRGVLKRILSFLSKKTINKHNAEVIVVTGWTGTPVVREMIYHFLKDTYNVRRNTTSVWWDLSVPLTILGYEDKKRNMFEWLIVIVKAYFSLMFNHRHSHKIVINLDSANSETARFWTRTLNPHMVVVLRERPESKFIKNLLASKGWEKILFVYNPDMYPELAQKRVREFTFEEKGKDIRYVKKDDEILVQYKNETIKIKIPSRYKFIWEFIPASFSVGLLQGISLSDLAARLTTFDFHPGQVKKAISGLKKFVLEDEK